MTMPILLSRITLLLLMRVSQSLLHKRFMNDYQKYEGTRLFASKQSLQTSSFGESKRFSIVTCPSQLTKNASLTLAIYCMTSGPKPALRVWLKTPSVTASDSKTHPDQRKERERLSIAQNQVQYALGFIANIFIVNATGPQVPWTGLVFNTTTSFRPFIPWKKEDELAGSRAVLMTLIKDSDDELPKVIRRDRAKIYEKLDHIFFNQNRYWPEQIQLNKIKEQSIKWLLKETNRQALSIRFSPLLK